MRLVFKSVLLAVAALALTGVMAAAASAETGEWLLNGSPVKESTPVTDTATAFSVHYYAYNHAEGEALTCELGGKGTVSAKGAGTITAWNLTKCSITKAGLCEAGTLSGPTALNLPWKTQLTYGGGKGLNEVLSAKEKTGGQDGVTWQCKEPAILGGKLFKFTCLGTQKNEVEKKGGLVQERWEYDPSMELHCEVSLGSEKFEDGYAILKSLTDLKAEKGELSFE